jgi:hypothetical protein
MKNDQGRSTTDSIQWYCPKCDKQTSQTAEPNRTKVNHNNGEVFLVRKCSCNSELRTVEITVETYTSFFMAIKKLHDRLNEIADKVETVSGTTGDIGQLYMQLLDARNLLKKTESVRNSAAKRWDDYLAGRQH